MGSRHITTVRLLFACSCTLAFATPPAMAAEPSVPDDYYSVGFDFSRYGVANPDQTRTEASLQSMAETGIDQARVSFSWAEMEPSRTGAGHTYVFQNFDNWVETAARQGVRIQAMFGYSPSWATDSEYCKQSLGWTSARPTDIFSWRLAVRAFVNRYGRNGSFWAAHPEIPQLPITSYEIWNEPNLKYYWCPAPQPEIYGTYLDVAEQEISFRHPEAAVSSGGIPVTTGRHPNTAVSPTPFLKRMLSAAPSLVNRLDGIGIHPYAFGDRSRQLTVIADFRQDLQEAGIPNSMPMVVTEIGFSTAGAQAVSEAERAERYRLFTTQIPRSNCNVSGVSAHTWVSREAGDKTDAWFGISLPATGAPYPTATSYGQAIALMRGKLAERPPKESIKNCQGMPKLDRDGDGVPDESDDYPIDPTRSENGGGGGGGGGLTTRDCTVKLVALRGRIATTTGAEQQKATARYRRMGRRCIPCDRKIARLTKRIRSGDGNTGRLKRRRAAIRQRCAPCTRKLESIQEQVLVTTDPNLVAELLVRHDRVLTRCTGSRK